MPDDIRRFPASYRKVSGIRESDVRVSILGTIIDKHDDSLIIDDGTGKIKVSFQETDFDQKHIVRVLGRVIPTPTGCELQGEVIQDMSNLDLDLFKKMEALCFR